METVVPTKIESNSGKTQQPKPIKKDYKKMPPKTTAKTAEENKSWLLEWLIGDYPTVEDYLKAKFREAIKTVVGPKIRDIFFDSLGTLFGRSSPSPSSQSRSVERVSYRYPGVNSSYQKVEPTRTVDPRGSIYEDISFDTVDDANKFMEIISELFDDQQGCVSVLQFYDIAQRSTTSVQNNYGWFSLAQMKCEYVNGRYYIRMPNPVALNT